MNETKKTMIFGGVAIFLALLAFISSPRRVTPDEFQDENELFFPEFQDPNSATTLEVIKFDQETGSAAPFKVTFKDGKWTIPSHHDYPADGKDRLAKTAAGVIGIKKDEFRSDNVADYEALGVIDPLDETATSLTGRGERITIKGENQQVLADFIMSKEIEGRQKFRYVRIPDQKRVYACRVDLDISTKFTDWIESDLLTVNKDDLRSVTLKDYSIDERSGSLKNRDTIHLHKDGSDWKADKMTAKQEMDKTKVDNFLKTLDELSIVGVRTKPEGLTQSLQRSDSDGMSITQEAARSLQSKGFYFTRDGQLVSNEGEIQASTRQGVTYTLRFGEVVFGSGLEVSAGTDSPDEKGKSGAGENRYLFITTSFDGSQFKEPKKPDNLDFESKADSLYTDVDRKNKSLKREHDLWQAKIDNGQKTSTDLNNRFAKWYYVISAESFDKLNLQRSDFVKKKDKDT